MPKSSTSARKPATPAQPTLADHLETILDQLAGGTSLRAICASLGLKESTVRWWFSKDEDAAQRRAIAIEMGCDALADECVEIADDGTNDWMERKREDGSIDAVLNHEHVQRSKLRIDTRMRLIGKWSPGRYGDKVAVENTHKLAPEVSAWLGLTS